MERGGGRNKTFKKKCKARGQTQRQNNIATYKLNQPRGQFSENHTSLNIKSISILPHEDETNIGGVICPKKYVFVYVCMYVGVTPG